MNTFLERMELEEQELNFKILNIRNFLESDTFKNLSDGNKYLLKTQLKAMEEYSNILRTRVELNK